MFERKERRKRLCKVANTDLKSFRLVGSSLCRLLLSRFSLSVDHDSEHAIALLSLTLESTINHKSIFASLLKLSEYLFQTEVIATKNGAQNIDKGYLYLLVDGHNLHLLKLVLTD